MKTATIKMTLEALSDIMGLGTQGVMIRDIYGAPCDPGYVEIVVQGDKLPDSPQVCLHYTNPSERPFLALQPDIIPY